MSKRNRHHIQIFEHESLRVGELRDGVLFTEKHWKHLLQLNERQYPPYFQIIHQGIRALHYVGLLTIEGLTLEILPKISQKGGMTPQLLLLDMLEATGKLPKSSTQSLLAAQQGKLMDYFIDTFISEVEKLAAKGLVRQYRREYKNEHKFSGRIILKEHIRHNCVHKERVFSEQQVFDGKHLLHEFIQEALLKALNLSKDDALISRGKKLLNFFPQQTVRSNFHKISHIRLSREEAHYDKALKWAQILLYDLKPKLSLGKLSSPCFMLDMQQLFEEYVAIKLREASIKLGCSIDYQTVGKFWKRRSIRPDMVLRKQDGEIIILDTKWKRLKNGEPDDADLKQIYIYNRFFNAQRGVLLYPKQGIQEGYSAHYLHDSNTSISCEVAFVDLIKDDSNRLSKEWPMKLLKQILSKESIQNWH